VSLIVNIALSYGLPAQLRHAVITPILKKPSLDNNNLLNYRPVSNLGLLAKITEKIVASQLQSHFDINNVGDPCQYAYKRYHSCETALIDLCDYALTAMDKGECTLVVALDLSAAFDTINHDLLLGKLERMGIEGSALQWLKIYLMARTQAVLLDGHPSDTKGLISGVPQGSILGPLLFSIFMVDIANVFCKHGLKHIIYADDIQVMTKTSTTDLNLNIYKLEECIKDLGHWFVANSLCLNESKTDFIIFGSKHLLKTLPAVTLKIGSVSIHPSPQLRSLGVLLDCNLSMSEHVEYTCRIAFAFLRNISRIRRSLSRDTCLAAAHALVLSRTNYCGSLLHGIKKKELKKMNRVQNAVIRMVELLRKSDCVMDLRKANQWKKVVAGDTLRTCVIAYDALTRGSPRNISQLLEVREPCRNLRSGSRLQLIEPRSRTSWGRRSFRSGAPKLFNSLKVERDWMTSRAVFETNILKALSF
jgi:hypothetical protein